MGKADTVLVGSKACSLSYLVCKQVLDCRVRIQHLGRIRDLQDHIQDLQDRRGHSRSQQDRKGHIHRHHMGRKNPSHMDRRSYHTIYCSLPS